MSMMKTVVGLVLCGKADMMLRTCTQAAQSTALGKRRKHTVVCSLRNVILYRMVTTNVRRYSGWCQWGIYRGHEEVRTFSDWLECLKENAVNRCFSPLVEIPRAQLPETLYYQVRIVKVKYCSVIYRVFSDLTYFDVASNIIEEFPN